MYDLTSSQRDLMFILARTGGATGKELVGHVGDYYDEDVPAPTVYGQLDKLAKQRIIKKTNVGRSKEYSLTQRGVREVKARLEWERECLKRNDEFERFLSEHEDRRQIGV